MDTLQRQLSARLARPRLTPRSLANLVTTAVVTLVAATIVTWVLETSIGVPDASAVYLVAVVITAFVSGTPGAIAAAVGSFALYDYFFTEPRGRSPSTTRVSGSTSSSCCSLASWSASWPLCSAPAPPTPRRASGRHERSST